MASSRAAAPQHSEQLWQLGLAVAATLARKLVMDACEQLFAHTHSDDDLKLHYAAVDIHFRLQAPLSMERSAQAYDLMLEVRKNSPAAEDGCKKALVAIRDVLVLYIYCGMGDMVSHTRCNKSLEDKLMTR